MTRGVTLSVMIPTPEERPVDWTVRNQPAYGPPAAPVPPSQWPQPQAPYIPPPPPGSLANYSAAVYAPPQVVYVEQRPRTGTAVVALVLMLISAAGALCLFTWATAVIAIICGHFALYEIKRSNGLLRGRNMAIWSLVGAYPIAVFWTGGIIYAIATHNLSTTL